MITLDITTKRLLQDPYQRREWIKYQLKILGKSMAEVARNANPPKDRRDFYQVFNVPYPRVEKMIADALNLRPQDLFPERYNEHGLPARKMGRKPYKSNVKPVKNNTLKNSRNSQKHKAA